MTMPDDVRIVGWDPRLHGEFVRLNMAWLVGHALFEESDRKHFDRTRETILDRPGEVFFALDSVAEQALREGRPATALGSCAIAFQAEGLVEILKFAVDEPARGRGVGSLLLSTALDWARAHGAVRVALESSTKLTAALRLYERFGFEHRPFPGTPTYVTADVYMERAV